MSKPQYTVRTEGSRTYIHLEGDWGPPTIHPARSPGFVERLIYPKPPDPEASDGKAEGPSKPKPPDPEIGDGKAEGPSQPKSP